MNRVKHALPYAVSLMHLLLGARFILTTDDPLALVLALAGCACALGALMATVGADKGAPVLLRAPRALPGTPLVVMLVSALWIAASALMMAATMADLML